MRCLIAALVMLGLGLTTGVANAAPAEEPTDTPVEQGDPYYWVVYLPTNHEAVCQARYPAANGDRQTIVSFTYNNMGWSWAPWPSMDVSLGLPGYSQYFSTTIGNGGWGNVFYPYPGIEISAVQNYQGEGLMKVRMAYSRFYGCYWRPIPEQ